MAKKMSKTSARLVPDKMQKREIDRVMYLRHLFAYEFVKKTILGDSYVLDLGCGEGYGAANLSTYVKKVVGLEVNIDALNHAIAHYRSGNCFYKIYDGENIPFENKSFDCVTSFQVIEHVRNDVKFVHEIHRVLQHDGIFILTTPNRALRLKSGEKPWNCYHLREYDISELYLLLKKVFTDVKIYGIYGNKQIHEMEFSRIKTARIVTRIDFFGFRDIIPLKFRQTISNMINFLLFFLKSKKNNRKFEISDFYFSESTEGCLDLMAVCKK